jgi:hypothetical protein
LALVAREGEKSQFHMVILGIFVPVLLSWTRFDGAQRDHRDAFDGLLWGG